MSYIIPNNSVWDDLYRVRTERLSALKAYIASHAPALSLPPELLNWALNSYDIWYAALIKSENEWAEKEGATLAIHLAETPARERTNIIKELLASRYADYPTVREDYDLDESIPRTRRDMIIFADSLIGMHNTRKAAGDPLVLPDAMIDNFSALLNTLKTAIDNAKAELRQAKDATRELNNIFEADSKMLALLYDWAVAMWGADDPRMIEIGFVQRFPGSGGGGGDVPSVPEGFMLSWLDPTLKLSWNPVEGATSYQLAFSEDGGGTWEELYSGAEMGFEYEPPSGLRQYRVRARNANGYGEWSVILEYNIEEPAPVGSWPDELSGLYAIYHDFPSPFIEVGHDLQDGADGYNLKRVVVAIGDPDPTEEDMPVDNFAEGLTPDPYADAEINPGDKCAYWMCGVQGGVEGDWAGPVIGEYAG